MKKSMLERIQLSRRQLLNPYAYLDDRGNFNACAPKEEPNHDHKVSNSRLLLQNPFAHLNDKGSFDAALPPSTKGEFILPTQTLRKFIPGTKKNRYGYSEIESIANQLLRGMWANREKILIFEDDPMQVINSSLAIEAIGYNLQLDESLGHFQQNGKSVEVAGIIDNDNKAVHISRQFPLHIRNYTAAHELGHAVLHEGTGLHRDRALDGVILGGKRSPTELEADKFASFFLMPAKQVRAKFKQLFLTDQFSINENTLFGLDSHTATKFRENRSNLRSIARELANLEHYNGGHFASLAQQFGVSVEAMAIRLEELKLIDI